MVLALKILEFLRESGMTRKEFAEKSDIPISTLNTLLSLKNPNPTWPTILKTAKAANISLDAIAGIKSPDMGQEELDRITKEHEKTKALLEKFMREHDEYMAAHQDIVESLKETNRALEATNTALTARIKGQEKGIFWLRCLIGLFASLFLLFVAI